MDAARLGVSSPRQQQAVVKGRSSVKGFKIRVRWVPPRPVAPSICVSCAREYQIVAGLATDWRPLCL